MLTRIGLSRIALGCLIRSAVPLRPGALTDTLNESIHQLGVRRNIHVYVSDRREIPMAWGIFKTYLVLPHAANNWQTSRLRAVLLHELGHVQRGDMITHALSQFVCAIYWFHPLVWFAAWRVHVERERACDDLVVDCGMQPSVYAKQLLAIITECQSRSTVPCAALAMTRTSLLEGRIMAILNESISRKPISRKLFTCIVCLGAIAAITVASLQAKPLEIGNETTDTIESGTDQSSLPPDDQRAGETTTVEETPAAKLQKLGAAITRDETLPGKPITAVSLYGKEVSDTALAHVAHLKDVRELSLHSTAITDEGLKHLEGLSGLRSIVLNRTSITDAGLNRLAGLHELTHLFLTATQISGDGLVHLSQLPNLEALAIHYTKVDGEGLQHVKGLRELKYLGLAGPLIDDNGLSHLESLPRLEELEVWSGQVTNEGLNHLSELKTLKRLDLSWCTKVSNQGLAHLRGLSISDLAIWDLKKVTDEGLQHLDGMPMLHSLTLSGTSVTATGLGSLKSLPKLAHLELNGDQFTEEAARHLNGLPRLNSLGLSDPHVGDVLANVDQLKDLEELRLRWGRGVRVSDEDLAALKTSTQIERISLRGGVTDTALIRLKNLPQLRSLIVWNSGSPKDKLTDASLAHLAQISSLQELVLCDTQISQNGFRNLGRALPKVEISDQRPN